MTWTEFLRGVAIAAGIGVVVLIAVGVAALVDRRHARRNVADAVEQAREQHEGCRQCNPEPCCDGPAVVYRRRPMPNIRAARIDAEVQLLTANIDAEWEQFARRQGGAQ